MPLDPVADDRREFAELEVEAPVGPRREADRVFFEPQLRAIIAGIEGPVGPALRKQVDPRSQLRIEEETQARVEKIASAGEDQAGRGQGGLVVLDRKSVV